MTAVTERRVALTSNLDDWLADVTDRNLPHCVGDHNVTDQIKRTGKIYQRLADGNVVYMITPDIRYYPDFPFLGGWDDIRPERCGLRGFRLQVPDIDRLRDAGALVDTTSLGYSGSSNTYFVDPRKSTFDFLVVPEDGAKRTHFVLMPRERTS